MKALLDSLSVSYSALELDVVGLSCLFSWLIVVLWLCGCVSLGYHFSGISGNLEMSGNSAEVREKAQIREMLGKGQGICVVWEI